MENILLNFICSQETTKLDQAKSETSLNGGNLGLTTGIASNVNSIVGQKLPLFYYLCFTWNDLLNDPVLNLQENLGEAEYNEINNTITLIKQALDE